MKKKEERKNEESEFRDGSIAISRESTFDDYRDSSHTGILTYLRRFNRYVYPFNFQDKQTLSSRSERLVSFFLEVLGWIK